MTKISLGIKSS